ncbi:MAG: M20/M25/M40 family metallo-hydrolase [Alicyclobacillaceae bacterium]|uniref:M20/M25/M40 family metallo-hydrolase n=1 Tax=Alicyclobacillus sp. SP_1 TaxID=2942475 RepID=UPI0021576426|nr:M20/M25/M40 family metallo-hydrolase [Alicyclobacillus sp. SP_1]MCY0887347.1 M20/M25/M40 family metallo-hydrolase [Alicyclobacillaceae bacterium]
MTSSTSLSLATRNLTLDLVAIPSVNGSAGESTIVEFLHHRLSRHPRYGRGDFQLFLVPSTDDPLFRPTLIAHRKGRSQRGILLFGHTDTVGTSDYGALESLAYRPMELTELVKDGVFGAAAAARAKSGEYLFGRGILDMKSGVAAALTAFEHLLDADVEDHLFFAATPDEEVSSLGVKTLSAWLDHYLETHGIVLTAAINTDYVKDPPSSAPHPVYLGSIGKLLPAVYVRGVPSHAAEPEAGLDPNFVLAHVTARIVYNEDLCDAEGDERSPLPVSLSQKDGKPYYDVQTAVSATGYYNLFHMHRTPTEQLARFRSEVESAVQTAMKHATRRSGSHTTHQVPVYTYATLWEMANEEVRQGAQHYASSLTFGVDLRERCRLLVEYLVEQVQHQRQETGPVVVVYFANGLIPRVDAGKLVETSLVHGLMRFGREADLQFEVRRYFPYISDLSFLTSSPDWDDPTFSANFPTDAFATAGPKRTLPTLMVGSTGIGAHQPDESVHTPYTFNKLPHLLCLLATCLERG